MRPYEEPQYLEGKQVTLQTVSDEDGFCTEHTEQHSLNVSQTHGGVFQILLCHTWKSVKNIYSPHDTLFIKASSGWCNNQTPTPCVKSHNSPRVVIYHFAFRFDERIVDDFHLRVDDRHPRQFQALLGVTLIQTRKNTFVTQRHNKMHFIHTEKK